MKIYFDYNDVPAQGAVITLGNFDGFHLGHQRILSATVGVGSALGLPALVMTFQPHPRRFFGGDLPLITPLGQKLALLKRAGADLVLVQAFTRTLADLAPEVFFREVLVRALGVRHLVVGWDYSFGRGGAGDTAFLQELAARHRLGCDIIPPVRWGQETVSSSAVRRFLAGGQVEKAAALLGRAFSLKGRVLPGAGRGKSLGFPTANLYPPRGQALPAYGVYLVRACTRGRSHWGVANIGRHPTFPGGEVSLEVHLLDFSGDLYGRLLQVSFLKGLRGERKFSGPAALALQLVRDVELAKTLLARDSVLKL